MLSIITNLDAVLQAVELSDVSDEATYYGSHKTTQVALCAFGNDFRSPPSTSWRFDNRPGQLFRR